MTAFVLKMIAIVSMVFDHFGYYFYNGNLSFFNYLGRLAFPIFAFQISEGYIHTRSVKKYMSRLFIFALISQIPFMLFEYSIGFEFSLNIFFTLFLGLLCILIYDKSKYKILSLLAIGIICALGELIHVDYGYWGILLIFVFYFFKENEMLLALSFLVMCILRYSTIMLEIGYTDKLLYLCMFTFLSIIPILLYNGKLGPKTKRLLYIFYPVHLLVLYIASLF